ncbi:SOS response-associated peptidase [Foetidibacter luteolus]|uniref:SOS response-associated peptidase n=1 Tax=Foetidibacter luteolus TaxID=2608880 RepID=UPI001F2B7EBC|nr:SOS response-associated peptidase family protein [Foetidibacter luteolus]
MSDYFPDLVWDDQIVLDFDKGVHIQAPGVFGEHAIIYRNREDLLPHCRLMEWGVIPHYVSTEKKLIDHTNGRTQWANIRSERVLDDKASYWYKIRNRRCLVPLVGTYEHREVKGWKKKVPYYIKPCEQEVFFVPGLYAVAEVANESTGEVTTHRTFGMMTRAANSVMKQIHNSGPNKGRMPLFLPFEMSKAFIQHELSEAEYRGVLNYEMPSEDLLYFTTDTIRTTKPRADGKRKNEEFEWAKLPPLGVGDPD